MKYRVIHKTEYIYEEPASLSYNEARLLPRSFTHQMFEQTCLTRQVSIEPAFNDYRERADFFGNRVIYFTIPHPHEQLNVTAMSEVQVTPAIDAPQATTRADQLSAKTGQSPPWEAVRDHLKTSLNEDALEARQFVMNSALISVFPELTAYAAFSFPAGRPVLEAVSDLMRRIYNDFAFVSGVTTITTPLSELLQTRQGVCQDFTHLMVGCLRAQGLAARYVSGYIETLPPPGQEKLAGADASHAWCSVYTPEAGWIDFDPTNNLIPKDQHITLAWGRDFADVTPLKGVFFSHGRPRLHVAVDVERI